MTVALRMALQSYFLFRGVKTVVLICKMNAVFWDIKIQFVPHRRHITSLLQSQTG
jgi:hypothetical protein